MKISPKDKEMDECELDNSDESSDDSDGDWPEGDRLLDRDDYAYGLALRIYPTDDDKYNRN